MSDNFPEPNLCSQRRKEKQQVLPLWGIPVSFPSLCLPLPVVFYPLTLGSFLMPGAAYHGHLSFRSSSPGPLTPRFRTSVVSRRPGWLGGLQPLPALLPPPSRAAVVHWLLFFPKVLSRCKISHS